MELGGQYKYLGVTSNNTKLSFADKNVSLKASRALILVQQLVFDKALKPFAVMHMFDYLVKPFALNGSEVWSAYKKKDKKNKTNLETIHDFNIRKCISVFHISAHKLRIAQGRYKGERLEERLCKECNEVETKVHFLCQCKKYEIDRKSMYENVNNSIISYSDPYVTFFNLLTSHDGHLLKAIGKCILDCSVT